MKIFVTGGTGFVGSHFLNQTMAQGYDVIALRRPSSQPRLPLISEPVWVDGALDGDFPALFSGVDVFVHLASHTPNPPYDTLDKCLYWNVFAANKLAKQAIDQGVKKFIIAGTCFEYGRSAERGELEVDTPLEPTLSYPTSKAAASIAFLGLARDLNLQMKLLRIFQVYGEGEQATRLWPSMKAAALAGEDFAMSAGDQIRNFIPVEEVARQFVDALNFTGNEAGQPEIRHVATEHTSTLLEFSQNWWERWQAKGKLKVGEVPYRKNEMMRISSKSHSMEK